MSTEITLKVINAAGEELKKESGKNEINLVYLAEYQEGDQIVLETVGEDKFLWLQVDDAIGKSLVYVTGKVSYLIPFNDKKLNLSPRAFLGDRHLISARIAKDFEITAYRNLAMNVNDQHGIKTMFPHVETNVETRGESVFAAQNTIDGITAVKSHGLWPYQSWGIGRRADAELVLDFGRKVETDRIILYRREDYPHDNWWREVTIMFSDETKLTVTLTKEEGPSEICFEKKEISWLKLCDLKQCEEDPSPFPALTQIEVYGYNKEN